MSKEVDNLREERELYQLRSLIEDLHSNDWQVQIGAINSLNKVKKTKEFYAEALPVVLSLCSTDNDLLRQALIPFLGELNSAGGLVVNKLIEFLNSTYIDEVKAAVYGLGKIGPDSISSIIPLVNLLQTTDEDLFKAVSWALSMLGPDAVNDLTAAANSDIIRIKVGCINALGNMGPIAESSVPSIIGNLKHQNSLVRLESAKAIGNLRAIPSISACIPHLNSVLDDDDPDVRWTAAEALRKIGTEEAMGAWANYKEVGSVDSYIKQLSNQDKAVRLHAAESLYSITDHDSEFDEVQIKKSIFDNYSKVVIALCEVLPKLEERAFVYEKELIQQLDSSDPLIRAAIAQAIGKISIQSADKKLISMLNDPVKEVRMAAGLALEYLDTNDAKAALKKFKWE